MSEKRWFLWDRKFDGVCRQDHELPGWAGGWRTKREATRYAKATFNVTDSERRIRFAVVCMEVP